jgi:hypothetical protein
VLNRCLLTRFDPTLPGFDANQRQSPTGPSTRAAKNRFQGVVDMAHELDVIAYEVIGDTTRASVVILNIRSTEYSIAGGMSANVL